MRSQSLRRWILVFCAVLLLAAPAGGAQLSDSVGGVVVPAGGCDDGGCYR